MKLNVLKLWNNTLAKKSRKFSKLFLQLNMIDFGGTIEMLQELEEKTETPSKFLKYVFINHLFLRSRSLE